MLNNTILLGDNPPHDIWNETWASQLTATDYIVNYVASKLPGITIYPAMGNHGKNMHVGLILCPVYVHMYHCIPLCRDMA